MKKAIEILVLRVSSNGKYIEFIINCPEDYFFTDFTVQVYGSEDIYSLKECLFTAAEGDDDAIQPSEESEMYDEDTWYHNKLYYSGQFKVSDLGVTRPEMYKINLVASHNEGADSDTENELEENECWHIKEDIKAEAFISDVAKAYTCLMQDILAAGEDLCDNNEALDKVIRNYLILYAHLEAMHLHELDEARKYFKLLNNCFSTCGDGAVFNGTCNLCNGGTLTEYIRFDTYKPSSCGCGRK